MPDLLSTASMEILRKPVLAHVATLGADGEPHVTPVWIDVDGDDLLINTALGRAKARNLANDARVAVSLTDPDNDSTVIAIRGTVIGFTTDGGDDVIDRLAKKYMGVDSYPFRREGEIRVTVRIQTDRISQQPT